MRSPSGLARDESVALPRCGGPCRRRCATEVAARIGAAGMVGGRVEGRIKIDPNEFRYARARSLACPIEFFSHCFSPRTLVA